MMTVQSLTRWTNELRAALRDLEAKHDPDPADAVMQCYSLLVSGPRPLCEALVGAIDRDEIDRLLRHHAPESAALRLLDNCGYMLSGSGGSLCIASVKLPTGERDHSFSARTLPVAVCGAVATALLDGVTEE